MSKLREKMELLNSLVAKDVDERLLLLIQSQNQMRWLVYNYLNYDFLNKKDSIDNSKLNSPLLIKNLNLFINTFKKINFTECKDINFNKNIEENELLNLIKDYYFNFKKMYFDINSCSTKAKTCNIKIENIRYNEFKKSGDFLYIRKICNELYKSSHLVKTLLLHGSYATDDYINGWSDTDLFMIIPRSTINDIHKMKELRSRIHKCTSYFLKSDPLQIHGILLCTEFDQDFYSQSYFPFKLMEYSKVLFGTSTFQVNSRQFSEIDYWETFAFEVVSYFLDVKLSDIKSLIDKKLLIHRILIMPVYFLQIMGIHSYKKYSFEALKGFIDKDQLGVFVKATEIMNSPDGLSGLSRADIDQLHDQACAITKIMLDEYYKKAYA